MPVTLLAFAESRDGVLRKTAFEVLSAARGVAAALDARVTALLAGRGVTPLAAGLGPAGASEVVVMDDPLFERFSLDGLSRAIIDTARDLKPALILLSASAMGRDLAPAVAEALGGGFAADVIDLRVEGGRVLARRPVYAGKAYATVECLATPFVVSLRPNVFPPLSPVPSATAALVQRKPAFGADAVRDAVVELLKPENRRLDVTEADVIVAGGRGVGGPEGFKPLEELAAVLGAAVGASRAVVDAGWRGHSEQVGQTGKVVSPSLYIACGISGAIQHLAGMRTSRVIVAINRDPEAPIFKVADYGIVGDVAEVVPALTEALRGVVGS